MTSRAVELNLTGAFLRRTDLSKANLRRANLSRADFSGAIFRGADLADANLDGTILRGADLADVRNMTAEQLRHAVIDATTILPAYLSLHEIAPAA